MCEWSVAALFLCVHCMLSWATVAADSRRESKDNRIMSMGIDKTRNDSAETEEHGWSGRL